MIKNAQEELLLLRCLKMEKPAIEELTRQYGSKGMGFLVSLLGEQPQSLYQDMIVGGLAKYLHSKKPFQAEDSILVGLIQELLPSIYKIQKTFSFVVVETKYSLKDQILLKALSNMRFEERLLLLLRDQMSLQYDEITFLVFRPLESIRHQVQQARLSFRNFISQQTSSDSL